MSTRHQKTTGPLSLERYMSSPEFAELHGINGVAMSARSAVLMCNRKRNLLWFIQSMSLADGGLNRVARELLAMFPDRLVSADARATALKATSRNEYPFCEPVLSLPEFMVDLCINPRILFDTPGEDVEVTDLETHSAMDANPGLAQGDFKKARLPYFNDIISALFEYQKRHESGVRKAFQHTAISRKIWETLDFGLAQRSMVVLDGLEGRGKTESVKAWCSIRASSRPNTPASGLVRLSSAPGDCERATQIGFVRSRLVTVIVSGFSGSNQASTSRPTKCAISWPR